MTRRRLLTLAAVALSALSIALVFLGVGSENGWLLLAGIGVGVLALIAVIAMLEEVDGE